MFATTTANRDVRGADDDYKQYEDITYYTPVRKVDFSSGRSVIFHEDNVKGEFRYVPYEVKESTLKNFLGVFGMNVIDYFFHPGIFVYSIGCIGFAVNWIYRVYSYMGYAITKIELHNDGKTVTITFKTGGTETLKIKDI